MAIAYIALGSNLQQPAQQVQLALQALQTLPHTQVLKASSLYQTTPVGYDNQPDFINAVASIETQLQPQALLAALLAIEQQFGRERPFANAPRILDLDVLLYANEVMHTPTLTLPHPRMHERGFVMLPLAEIAPELILPNGSSVVELAQQCQQQGVLKLTGH